MTVDFIRFTFDDYHRRRDDDVAVSNNLCRVSALNGGKLSRRACSRAVKRFRCHSVFIYASDIAQTGLVT